MSKSLIHKSPRAVPSSSRPVQFSPARWIGTLAFTAAFAGSSPVQAQNFLLTARLFGVLGAETVTNTNATTIKGDLGVHPGSAISGIGSITLNGALHQTDAVAAQAKIDAGIANTTFMGMPVTQTLSGQNLGGMTLTAGVYKFESDAFLTGNLNLDFQGNPNALFVFQIGTALTTSSASSVTVINGSTGGGVYWQVGSQATLGTTTTFLGNILAGTSVVVQSGARILCGRAIALTAQVTLDNNVISNDCDNGGDYGSGKSDYGSVGFSGATTTVPEPSTFILMAAGGVALIGAVRRRRRLTNLERAA